MAKPAMERRDAIAQGWHDAHTFLRGYAVKTRADIEPEKWAYDLGVEIVEEDTVTSQQSVVFRRSLFA